MQDVKFNSKSSRLIFAVIGGAFFIVLLFVVWLNLTLEPGKEDATPKVNGVDIVAQNNNEVKVEAKEEGERGVEKAVEPVAEVDLSLIKKEDLDPTLDYAGIKASARAVEFKFAPEKTYLPDGARAALTSTALAGARGQKLVIVTRSNPSADKMKAHKLAQDRAQGIRQMLLALGCPENNIIMLKPTAVTTEEMTGPLANTVDIVVEKTANYSPFEMF